MARTTYHHGDLPHALVAAAVVLARAGGPDAVVLREVARRVQVSPAAIYRHYPDREALLGEVAVAARRDLARRMVERAEQVPPTDERTESVERFIAIGRGYLEFADDEPNLLATAFLPIEPPEVVEDPSPWHVLATALDELVATGAMRNERRAGAEAIVWSTVHGFAVLRTGHAFDTSGEPRPDLEAVLEAIVRSLDIRAR